MGSEFREIAGLTQENLTKVHTPVLAIYGGASPYAKMAEHLSRALPNCRWELLHEAGHFYAVEEPALVLDRLNGFMRDPAAYLDLDRPGPPDQHASGDAHPGKRRNH
jgi:pimeloyl-ACP methyl ester carboxylesterase